MYCDRCGAQLQQGQHFCHACGRSFATQNPAPYTPRRVANNVRALGIFWIVYSVLHLRPSAVLFSIPMGFHWGHWHMDMEEMFAGALLSTLGGFVALASLLGVIAGWGLLDRRPWARMFAIVLGCLALINIPFGTALGIFTLYVLLSDSSEREYRELAAQP